VSKCHPSNTKGPTLKISSFKPPTLNNILSLKGAHLTLSHVSQSKYPNLMSNYLIRKQKSKKKGKGIADCHEPAIQKGDQSTLTF